MNSSHRSALIEHLKTTPKCVKWPIGIITCPLWSFVVIFQYFLLFFFGIGTRTGNMTLRIYLKATLICPVTLKSFFIIIRVLKIAIFLHNMLQDIHSCCSMLQRRICWMPRLVESYELLRAEKVPHNESC